MSAAWIPLILGALDRVLDEARERGIDPPDVDEAREILTVVEGKLSQILPIAATGVALFAAKTASEISEKIESLGDTPFCPRCRAVLRQHVQKSIGGERQVDYSCDVCNWSSP